MLSSGLLPAPVSIYTPGARLWAQLVKTMRPIITKVSLPPCQSNRAQSWMFGLNLNNLSSQNGWCRIKILYIGRASLHCQILIWKGNEIPIRTWNFDSDLEHKTSLYLIIKYCLCSTYSVATCNMVLFMLIVLTQSVVAMILMVHDLRCQCQCHVYNNPGKD